MGLAADDVGRVVAGIAALTEAHLLAQHAQRRVVDPRRRNLSALDEALEVAGEQQGEGHLDVLSGERRGFGVAHAEDEIGHHEAVEAPRLA